VKKFAAIFSLSVLLFTAAGYRLLVNFLEHSARENLQAVIEEKTYDPEHLIELSVNLNLPYMSDWHEWEAVEGMVTIEGIPYQYVERILKGGKMTYRCLPNGGMQQALSARDRFMQLSFDFTHPSGQKSPLQTGISIKPPLPELYCLDLFSLNPPVDAEFLHHTLQQPFCAFSNIILSVPTPPPDIV
jgi:hypothetical protein